MTAATACPSTFGDVAMRPRRQTITTSDGISLAVEEFGGDARAAITIVLQHGLCLSKESWSPQIRLLLRRYGNDVRIIRFDLRGHGQSSPADMDSYTVEQLGHDLAEVLRLLGVSGQVILVGHSMGAMALLAYCGLSATSRPIEPAGLVLVATAAGRIAERGLGRLLALPLFGVLSGSIDRLPHRAAEHTVRTLVRPICRTVTRICGYRELERDTLVAAAYEALRCTSLRTAIGYLTSLKTLNLYGVLPTISSPTTVLSGTDLLTPVAHSHELTEGIPQAVHRHIPNAGHMLLNEAPHAVLEAISDTIATATTPVLKRQLVQTQAGGQ